MCFKQTQEAPIPTASSDECLPGFVLWLTETPRPASYDRCPTPGRAKWEYRRQIEAAVRLEEHDERRADGDDGCQPLVVAVPLGAPLGGVPPPGAPPPAPIPPVAACWVTLLLLVGEVGEVHPGTLHEGDREVRPGRRFRFVVVVVQTVLRCSSDSVARKASAAAAVSVMV